MKKWKSTGYVFLRSISNLFLMFSHLSLYYANFLRLRLYLTFEYEQRQDDIYISTYPKAGSTALQMMLYQMTTDGGMEMEHISTAIPWLEEAALINAPCINELKSPRIFKTHLNYKLLPKNGKVIYMVRNIKDTCVSYFHHLLSEKLYMNYSFNSYLDIFIKGGVPWGHWNKHLISWWPHRNDTRVLFLQYDELKNDPEGVVRKIDRFCGFHLSEEKINAVVEKCDIHYMKKHNHVFDPRLAVYRRSDQKDFGASFIRKGASTPTLHIQVGFVR